MNKKIFLTLFTAFLIACSGNEEIKIPDTVLPEQKMAEVMVDVHLMEATMNLNIKNVDNVSSGTNVIPSVDIFKKHHINKKQFDESYTFYTHNPELLVEVFEMVLNDLSKMQAEAMKK